MGLLGDGWSDPQSNAVMQLAGGLLSGNFGQGAAAYGNTMAGAKDAALKRQYLQSQMDENNAVVEQKRAQTAEAQRIRSLVANFGVLQDGAALGSVSQDGQTAPRSAPDYTSLIRQGVPVEIVKSLAESANFGRPKVARTADIEGPNGAKMIQGFDDYGMPVGQGASGYVAPQLINQGDRQTFAKPMAGASFGVNMSASERDSSARGWAGVQNSRARLAFDQAGGVLGVRPAKQGPMSVTLQKELIESDDVIQSSNAVVDILGQAKTLNSKAYSGYGAKARAVLASNLPGDNKGADATIDLDNMMTGQGLESLKSIFGAAPTEGERKILMDMQASADKTPAQREAIMDRAIGAAKRRGSFADNKAKAIRDGTYLTQGVPAAPQPASQPAPAANKQPAPQAMKGMVRGGYKFKGGDPSNQANWEKQ